MSKKNLARTAIEGGRTGSSKYDRRHADRQVRAETRAFVSRVINDPDAADNDYVPSKQEVFPHSYREFRDKLRPVRRWMDKQVGRVWDEVHAELRERFDTRTTAGRHILFDHILDDVDPHPYVIRVGYYAVSPYFVDEDGLLRTRDRTWRHYRNVKRTVTDTTLLAWRGVRFVREIGNEVFWVVCVRDKFNQPTGYRQDKKLNVAERKFYNSLIESEKRLVQTPVRE